MVPPYSHGISRAPWYSGYRLLRTVFVYGALTLYRRSSQSVRLFLRLLNAVLTPERLLLPVWPLPRSLATTSGISVDFFSSPYLDVSVQAVPRVCLFYSTHTDILFVCRVSPFGNPRVDGCFRLTVAYRRSLRPSSAPGAKAFPLRSF